MIGPRGQKPNPFEKLERLAILMHKDSCIRRGEMPVWNGKRTNRTYWRRMARKAESDISDLL